MEKRLGGSLRGRCRRPFFPEPLCVPKPLLAKQACHPFRELAEVLHWWIPPRCEKRPGSENTAMPKQKTHKGTKKRFRLSANGKIKHRSAGTSHLAARKTQKRIRKLRGTEVLAPAMAKQIKKALAGNSY